MRVAWNTCVGGYGNLFPIMSSFAPEWRGMADFLPCFPRAKTKNRVRLRSVEGNVTDELHFDGSWGRTSARSKWIVIFAIPVEDVRYMSEEGTVRRSW